jgi:ribosomal protein S18 acetylase RimI-like enzyme
VTRFIDVSDATILALERHEAQAHAIPSRHVRDLGDAIALVDPVDPEPFWNRLQAVRWPEDEPGFDRSLTRALAFFASIGRIPHVWPSPAHPSPRDLAPRLVAHGFRDVGGGHLMVLEDPARCAAVDPGELGQGVSVVAIRSRADAADTDADDIAQVLAESFGALPGRTGPLAADLRTTLDDPRIVLALVRVDGEPAAAAKATTFGGWTYVSSVGTRMAFRGRSLAGIATRHVLTAGGRTLAAGTAYLGVFSGNEPALRLYDRLGFASAGESPDLLLE